MRAMAIDRFGGPDELKPHDLPEPDPARLSERDLLIEVHACAVNPVDTKIRRGMIGERDMPLVLGYDVSGVVRAIGSAVEGFAVGDEVYASPSLGRPGANAELVAVDFRAVAHRPQGVGHAECAALPLVTLTAWEALHDHARLHPSETVLIHAGGGGVGHIAIQLAKLHGSRVITTASQDASKKLCRELGADVVIDYQQEDVAKRIENETDGKGCPVVFDTVGDDVFTQSIDLVGVNGRLVTILAPPEGAPIGKLFRRNASVHMEFMGVPALYDVNLSHQGQTLRTVAELVDAGKLRPHISHRYQLEDLPEAHRQQETGHTVGKLVVELR